MKPGVLVVGGTGFVGEYVVRALKSDADVSVIHREAVETKEEGVTYTQVDLSNDMPSDMFVRADTIVWLVTPVQGLLERTIPHVSARFVYASTLLLYPDSASPCREDGVLDPRSEYEQAKFSEEMYLEKNIRSGLTILRFGNVYGDVKNTGIVGNICKAIINHTSIVVQGTGEQKRDFVLVDDVARAVRTVVNQKAEGVYNVCTGTSVSILGLLSLFQTLSHEVPVTFVAAETGKSAVRGDNRKIVSLLDTPFTQLNEGLQTTLSRYTHARDLSTL